MTDKEAKNCKDPTLCGKNLVGVQIGQCDNCLLANEDKWDADLDIPKLWSKREIIQLVKTYGR